MEIEIVYLPPLWTYILYTKSPLDKIINWLKNNNSKQKNKINTQTYKYISKKKKN